jgi:hypothetical protein
MRLSPFGVRLPIDDAATPESGRGFGSVLRLLREESGGDFAFRPGDLFACYGGDKLSKAISYRTVMLRGLRVLRGPSHVAIAAPFVVWSESDEETDAVTTPRRELLWYESTSLCDRRCVCWGERRSGVQAHAIQTRIDDYTSEGGSVSVYRLASWSVLDRRDEERLRCVLMDFLARRVGYDVLGAWGSVHRFSRHVDADTQKVFCSELVALALMEVGRLPRRNPAIFHPNKLIRSLVKMGIYRPVFTFTAPVCEGGA